VKPLAEFPLAARRALVGVFTDIDDTLTSDGQLTADAYAALARLRAAGLRVVPVTGRPAGWCDLIARLWPVDAVVGENGAFYMHYDRSAKRLRTVHGVDAATRAAQRERLAVLAREILAAVPGCALASDQAFREADLAIDFCEDVPPLPAAAVAEIVARMEAAGLTAKISSIHVNGWFGNYDKLSMTRRLVAELFGGDLDQDRERWVFVGDSPNDAPMFGFFPHAIGVANVRALADRIAQLPSYVTNAASGAGFVEVSEHLLAE
jgi:HAD superfamily hydrolase (TIGR01484 family)